MEYSLAHEMICFHHHLRKLLCVGKKKENPYDKFDFDANFQQTLTIFLFLPLQATRRHGSVTQRDQLDD